MREHDHDPDRSDEVRPKADEVGRAEPGAMYRAAAAGRLDAIGPMGILALQRTIGNAAVTHLIQRARAVETEASHQEAASEQQQPRSPVLDVVGKGGGQPLDAPVQREMDGRMGDDFSSVRVHTDAQADASAKAVQAKAYTVGSDIVFRSGAYNPHTHAGKLTLAHELSHVQQQRNGPVDGTSTGDGVAISDPSDSFEQAAEANATRVMNTPIPPAPTGPAAAATPGSTVQRCPHPETDTEGEPPVQRCPHPEVEESLQRCPDHPHTEEEPPVQRCTEAPEGEQAPGWAGGQAVRGWDAGRRGGPARQKGVPGGGQATAGSASPRAASAESALQRQVGEQALAPAAQPGRPLDVTSVVDGVTVRGRFEAEAHRVASTTHATRATTGHSSNPSRGTVQRTPVKNQAVPAPDAPASNAGEALNPGPLRITRTQKGQWKELKGKERADGTKSWDDWKNLTRDDRGKTPVLVESDKLSQSDLHMLTDFLTRAGEHELAMRLLNRAHALDQHTRSNEAVSPQEPARGTSQSTATEKAPDQRIWTGKEIQERAQTLNSKLKALETGVETNGGRISDALVVQASEVHRLADGLETALGGFIVDAVDQGGVYSLRNEHAPLFGVARDFAKRVEKNAGGELTGSDGKPMSVEALRAAIVPAARNLRTSKAYAAVPTGTQWHKVNPDWAKLSDEQKTQFIKKLSTQNLANLGKDRGELLGRQNLHDKQAQFDALKARVEKLPFRLKHATPAYQAIANSGLMAGQGDLKRRGANFLASGKSSDDNTRSLGNDDFVFFRVEANDSAMETRYGPTTMIFDLDDVLGKYGGWVSLHDQLHPLDRPAMQKLVMPGKPESGNGKPVRTSEYLPGHMAPGTRGVWANKYPGDATERQVTFDQEVFYGADDFRKGIALSVVNEVARIGGEFQAYALGLTDQAELGKLVSSLYRPEAKFPSGLPVDVREGSKTDLAHPINVVNKDGDGRYGRGGAIEPTAMAAAKKSDEAADLRRKAQAAMDARERLEAAGKTPEAARKTKEIKGVLDRAKTAAQDAEKLSKTFKDAAPDDQKELAGKLLNDRTAKVNELAGIVEAENKRQSPVAGGLPACPAGVGTSQGPHRLRRQANGQLCDPHKNRNDEGREQSADSLERLPARKVEGRSADRNLGLAPLPPQFDESPEAHINRVAAVAQNHLAGVGQGVVQGAGLAFYLKNLYDTFSSDSANDFDKAAAIGAIVPGLGPALGLSASISHGDTEGIVVNSLALGAWAVSQVIPVVGEVVDAYFLIQAAIQILPELVGTREDPGEVELDKEISSCESIHRMLAMTHGIGELCVDHLMRDADQPKEIPAGASGSFKDVPKTDYAWLAQYFHLTPDQRTKNEDGRGSIQEITLKVMADISPGAALCLRVFEGRFEDAFANLKEYVDDPVLRHGWRQKLWKKWLDQGCKVTEKVFRNRHPNSGWDFTG